MTSEMHSNVLVCSPVADVDNLSFPVVQQTSAQLSQVTAPSPLAVGLQHQQQREAMVASMPVRRHHHADGDRRGADQRPRLGSRQQRRSDSDTQRPDPDGQPGQYCPGTRWRTPRPSHPGGRPDGGGPDSSSPGSGGGPDGGPDGGGPSAPSSSVDHDGRSRESSSTRGRRGCEQQQQRSDERSREREPIARNMDRLARAARKERKAREKRLRLERELGLKRDPDLDVADEDWQQPYNHRPARPQTPARPTDWTTTAAW